MLNLNYNPIHVEDTDGMSNDTWLKLRTTGIGGSDVAALYDVSPWTTKRALYYAKLGLEKAEMPNPYTLAFGHAMEPFVMSWFNQSFEEKYKEWLEEELNVQIADFYIYKDTMMYRHPLYPYMQANLDYRWCLTTTEGKEIQGVFECKTTSYHIGDKKWEDDKVPYEYELQCRHYMSIMNLDYTLIACAWGNNVNDYRVRLIRRDLDIEEEMIEIEDDFWNRNVKLKNPPALSAEHASQELAAYESYDIGKKLKRKELPEITHNIEEVVEAAKKYTAIKEKIGAYEEQIKLLKNQLDLQKVKLLEASNDESAHVTDGISRVYINNKTVVTKRIDSTLLKKEQPDIYKNYLKKSESRRFNVSVY